MANFYIDPISGNDANAGSVAAPWKTITSGATAARIAAGDVIYIKGNPKSLVGNATWTKSSQTITLASAVTKNIELCETAWTASAGVTSNANTFKKQGSFSAALQINAAGFGTGLVAYKALAAAEDFSAYQQISLWFATSTVQASGTFRLCLCSDAAGTVVVDQITLPASAFANVYNVVTVDTGGALGASIQSVALYADVDPGGVIVYLDNILACKAPGSADSLSLTSQISKANGEGWYAIQSINDTAVLIEQNYAGQPGSKPYYGTTETVATYKREPYMMEGTAATSTAHNTVNDDGSATAPIIYRGGWDGVNPATLLTGEDCRSVFQSRNALGNMFVCDNPRKFIQFEYLDASRCWVAFSFGSSPQNIKMTSCGAAAAHSSGISTTVKGGFSVDGFYFNNGGGEGMQFNLGGPATFKNIKVHGANGVNSIVIQATNNVHCENIEAKGGGSYGLVLQNLAQTFISGLTTELNGTSGLYVGPGCDVGILNASIGEATECTEASMTDGTIRSQQHDLVADSHLAFFYGGRVASETGANRRTASGIAWKISPTATDRNADWPIRWALARVACVANTQVTVKVWVNRTNTGLTAKLVCKGMQIAGVASDVVASAAGAAGSYEELTITFTPTEAGVVEIEAQVYGGTTYSAYFDDMTISQA